MALIGEMKKLTIGGSTYTIPEYNLPIASASTLGGVKIGTGLSINSTTGVLSATGLDYDEVDPVFTASAAYGITSSDISNWNSKTSNTGTITKVQTTAGAHTVINVTSGAVAFNVPTKTSHLTNDSGFLTSHQDISGKANKATTLAGYGITDAYTKTEVNNLVSGVLHYKGTKATVADVAAVTSKSIGDVWHVTADGSEWAYDGNAWQELGTSIDLSGYVTHGNTGNAITGITATTTATKTTLGTATSVTGVSGSTTASKASGSNGSASNWVFEDVACDDITAWSAGSGSASLTFTMDTTDTKKLKISFSHSHTAPSLTYGAKTASHVKSGGNGTAPSWSFTDVTVPKAAASATSIPNVSVTSATVTVTDNGHTHTI